MGNQGLENTLRYIKAAEQLPGKENPDALLTGFLSPAIQNTQTGPERRGLIG